MTRQSSLLAVTLFFGTLPILTEAFLPAPTFKASSSSSSTVVYYKDDGKDGPADEVGSRNNNHILTIPVLGPIPARPPLMLGAEMTLDPPTPMQWQSLEETVYIHQKHIENESVVAGVDAAPLVAILDDYTGSKMGGRSKGRYATIAAVVGISSSCSSDATKADRKIDTTSESSFMESVLRSTRAVATPADSKIRLVGIGRAALGKFFYQVPHAAATSMDEEGHLILQEDDEEHGDDEEERPVNNNIIMAEFRLLSDSGQRTRIQRGRAVQASPVHALAEMSSWANKIEGLHRTRRKLVAGLQAAKARLQLAVFADDDDLEDYDGLGMLFSKGFEEEMEESQPMIDQLLEDFPTSSNKGDDRNEDDSQSPSSSSSVSLLSPSPLAQLENYGLGYSAASFSTVPALTKVWLEKLEPYYSPARSQSEEYYFEILSFVCMQSMDKYLQAAHMAWALQCTNTIERLEQAYEWMWSHVHLLKEEAERVSQDLRDCGEECTDLW